MATHCSIPAWRIPWTEELGGLQSIGSQRVKHDWSNLARTHTHARAHTHTHTCTDFAITELWGHGPAISLVWTCSLTGTLASKAPSVLACLHSTTFSLGLRNQVGFQNFLTLPWNLQGSSNKPGLRRLLAAVAAAKSLQSCLSLCDPIDGSPPCSTVP